MRVVHWIALTACAWLALSPKATMAQALPTLRDWATRCAVLRVPVGLVLEESMWRTATEPPAPTGTRIDPAGDSRKLVSELKQIAPDFRASARRGGTLSVRSAREPEILRTELDQVRFYEDEARLPAMDAIMVRIKNAVGKPRTALAGTSLPDPATCPANQEVHLTAGAKSLVEALDEVVSQVPGLVWVVTYDVKAPRPSMKIGFLCPDGSSFRTALHQ